MLNPDQRLAVEAVHGKVLILAGAGSGKTSVLVHRIAYLIHDLNIPPEAILGLTFTNKAANEMQERVAKMIQPAFAKKVTLSTFHSFCMQLLRNEIHHLGFTPDFTLYDEKDVKRVIQGLARRLLEHEGELPSLESTIAAISSAKQKGLSSQELKNHDPFFQELYTHLHSSMRAYNAVDFDSLLTLTVELFVQFPQVLEKYQERYRYIMIDEYQDTNPVQDRIASLLSQKHGNLCVVGDDDQSIYGWRGAEVKNILHFPADRTVRLEQNYRSTPSILDAANCVIRNNKERHSKSLWSSKEKGHPIFLFHAPNELDEAMAVVQRMLLLRKTHNLRWSDMALLYRSNTLSRPLETALLQTIWQKEKEWIKGIPYQIFGGTEFFDRAEVKDLIAYLRVIVNPLDEEALLRIINMPRRGISDQTLDRLTAINRKTEKPLWDVLKKAEECRELPDRALKSIQNFTGLIEEAREKFASPPLYSSFQWLIDTIHYKKAICDDVKSDRMRSFKWENVLECVQALKSYEERENEKPPSLSHFLATTLLFREDHPHRKKDLHQDRVSLMTFHGAKGLEFPACFLVGLEDHLIPHEKCTAHGNIEEERRLMYVAMTRAMRFLILSMAKQRNRLGKEASSSPSRFLFEIPKELLKISAWNDYS